MVQKAEQIWEDHMKSVKRKSGSSSDPNAYSFLPTTNDFIFMLYSLFKFECNRSSPFSKFRSEDIHFVERSKDRLQFQLDFTYQLWKIHVFSWSEYSNLVMNAVKLYPDVSAMYRHLANVFKLKPCRYRHFVEWKLLSRFLNFKSDKISLILDPKLKRRYALSMFASEYKLFGQACESDDYLLIDQAYKRIRKIFEESATLISNTSSPDSFIWRLWHFVERQNKSTTSDMEKV